MTEPLSFKSRRPAAGALPAFFLPTQTPDTANMGDSPSLPYSSSTGNTNKPSAGNKSLQNGQAEQHLKHVPRTSHGPEYQQTSSGTSDGLSPSLSSVNTGSSQGSQASGVMNYSYGGQVNGGWPSSNNSSYTVSSAPQTAQQPLSHQQTSQYGSRPTMYVPSPSIQFSHPRNSHSPAAGGDGLPPPPYDQVHQPFQTSMSGGGGGGGGQGGPAGMSSAPQPPHNAILSSQNPVSTQPPTSSISTTHADSYAHSRPSSTSNYFTVTTASQQPNFPAYAPQPSPPLHPPSTGGSGSRGLGSTMAPPAPYRAYATSPYPQLPNMGGSVLSNIHQPGGSISMMPGMQVPSYGHHPMMYGHGPQTPQSERPFKCDQCIQSFSRNHDLKRHKRIHLAVKPFPCTFCSKSFSRKDALKRHRLVKGCEGKTGEINGESNGSDGVGPERNVASDGSPKVKEVKME